MRWFSCCCNPQKWHLQPKSLLVAQEQALSCWSCPHTWCWAVRRLRQGYFPFSPYNLFVRGPWCRGRGLPWWPWFLHFLVASPKSSCLSGSLLHIYLVMYKKDTPTVCEPFSLMMVASFYKNGDSAALLNSFETLWLKISYFSPSSLKPTSCLLTQATWRSAGLHRTSDKRCTGLFSDAPKRPVPLHQGAAVWEDVHGPGWPRVGGHLLQ